MKSRWKPFSKGASAFPAIAEVVADTLERVPARTARTVGDILEIDGDARKVARQVVTARSAVVTA